MGASIEFCDNFVSVPVNATTPIAHSVFLNIAPRNNKLSPSNGIILILLFVFVSLSLSSFSSSIIVVVGIDNLPVNVLICAFGASVANTAIFP